MTKCEKIKKIAELSKKKSGHPCNTLDEMFHKDMKFDHFFKNIVVLIFYLCEFQTKAKIYSIKKPSFSISVCLCMALNFIYNLPFFIKRISHRNCYKALTSQIWFQESILIEPFGS